MIDWSDALRAPEPIERFVNLLPAVPAVLLDRHLDVLAVSRLARAIEPRLTDGENVVRLGVLAVDGGRYPPEIHADLANLLRHGVHRFQEDDRYVSIIGELVATSRGFAQAWADERRTRPISVLELTHHSIGLLRLTCLRLPLEGPAGLSVLLARGTDPESRRRLEHLEVAG